MAEIKTELTSGYSSTKRRLLGIENDQFNFFKEQSVAIDVAALATAGDGSKLSPYTGWEAGVNTLNETYKGNCEFHFVRGWFAFATFPNLAKYPHVTISGEGFGTVLKYIGAVNGKALNLVGVIKTTNDGIGNEPNSYGLILKNFLIDGNNLADDGLFLNFAHHGLATNIGVRNCLKRSLHTDFIILWHFDHFRSTTRIGDDDTDNESSSPINGIVCTGSSGSGGVTQAVTFTNPIVEGCSGDGLVWTNVRQSVVIGGAIETNGGKNLVINTGCYGNTIIGTDLEGSAADIDAEIAGDETIFQNVLSVSPIIFKSGAKNNQIIGGKHQSIDIQAGAVSTRLIGVNFSLGGGGVIIDNGINTEIIGTPRRSTENTGDAIGLQVAGQVVVKGDDGNPYAMTVVGGTLSAKLLNGLNGGVGAAASDNFTGTSVSNQWARGTYTTKYLSDFANETQNNTLTINLPSGKSGKNFGGRIGHIRNIADGGSERITVVSVPGTNIPAQVWFVIGKDPLNYMGVLYETAPNALYLVKMVNGTFSVVTSAGSTSFLKQWRLRRSGTNLIFEVSVDDFVTTFPVGSGAWALADWNDLHVVIEAGTVASAPATSAVVFDDYVKG